MKHNKRGLLEDSNVNSFYSILFVAIHVMAILDYNSMLYAERINAIRLSPCAKRQMDG